MTTTLIALISVAIGILSANIFILFYKKYNLGITGNTLVGVFGSIFFIKAFGRMGFDPFSIVKTGSVDILLLIVNFLISALGAIIFVILFKFVQKKTE
ncbi:MAG TPA: hypothetical protein ENK67_00975 [Flavobacteriia bacterium]|nr:hypothetical protein [Flavobacteriia bacterium]